MRNHKIIVRTGKHGRTRIYHIPETPRSYLYSYKPEYIAPTITDLGTMDRLIIERHPLLPYCDGKELSKKPGPYRVTDDLNHIRTISIMSQLPLD